jgi:asparagine synthase (glutamine-hydrolysing)
MSGILGVWRSQQETPWQAMLDDLNVLGRDAQGDWHDADVGLWLGRSQFFNTPESCLESPVVQSEGCVLVWDGRLDDRQSLLMGRSQVTDAQLIIEAYRRWGVECLRHLIGEYAFILWDRQQQCLFVGCDNVAGRTLAYTWDGQTLLVSSRVVTLLLHPQVEVIWDPVYLAHSICHLNAHPPGSTAFEQIRRLLPGEALLLTNGRLQTLQIGGLAIPQRYSVPVDPESEYERFGELLNRAVGDRLRTHRSVCTTLSGGLDSTTITAALLDHRHGVKAFSNITTRFPEFDERQPIQAFLDHYPQVEWQGVNGDSAWALTESWEHLPIPDDPLIACTVPMDLQLMRQMQQANCAIVFDGVWGDHLFFAGWHDLAKANHWQPILTHLRQQKSPLSALWREWMLPVAPAWIQTAYFQRHQAAMAPAWIQPQYLQQPTTQLAFQQSCRQALIESMPQFVVESMRSARQFGSLQVYRLFKAFHGLEATSPFQDQRLVEFAFQLHPVLQHDATYNKIFLRNANRSRLPDAIQWRPKTNFFDPLLYTGLGESEAARDWITQIKDDSFFSTIVNSEVAQDFLSNYQSSYYKNVAALDKYRVKEVLSLYYLIHFFKWKESILKFVQIKHRSRLLR